MQGPVPFGEATGRSSLLRMTHEQEFCPHTAQEVDLHFMQLTNLPFCFSSQIRIWSLLIRFSDTVIRYGSYDMIQYIVCCV